MNVIVAKVQPNASVDSKNKNPLVQLFRCTRCGKTFSESQPLEGVRIEMEDAVRVIELRAEGDSVRGTARLTRLDKQTVLNIVESAGLQCSRVLDAKLRNLKVEDVQIDEAYSFVGCLQQNAEPDDLLNGDRYDFCAFGRNTKLLIHFHVGKRDREAKCFTSIA